MRVLRWLWVAARRDYGVNIESGRRIRGYHLIFIAAVLLVLGLGTMLADRGTARWTLGGAFVVSAAILAVVFSHDP
jgi:hypothetical protein